MIHLQKGFKFRAFELLRKCERQTTSTRDDIIVFIIIIIFFQVLKINHIFFVYNVIDPSSIMFVPQAWC